jgi:hypothetical protein
LISDKVGKGPYSKALFNQVYFIYDNSKDLKILDVLDVDDKTKAFLLKNSPVYIIPLMTPNGEEYSYVLRAVESKRFYFLELKSKYPHCYGLQDFTNYTFNKPILLCEGIKDVLAIKKIYPYSLAYLTSSPNDELFDFLSNITNRIIFFPDSDKTGLKLKITKKLKEKFKFYSKYYTPFGKDLGEYWDRLDNKYLVWIKLMLKKEGII